MILDDGGDVIFYVFLGVCVEVGEEIIFVFVLEEEEVIKVQIYKCMKEMLGWFIKIKEVI